MRPWQKHAPNSSRKPTASLLHKRSRLSLRLPPASHVSSLATAPGTISAHTSLGMACGAMPGSGVCRVSGYTLARRGQRGVVTSMPVTGLILKTGPRMALLATGETMMSSTTDHAHERRDQTVHPSIDAQVPDDPLEASCEAIER